MNIGDSRAAARTSLSSPGASRTPTAWPTSKKAKAIAEITSGSK